MNKEIKIEFPQVLQVLDRVKTTSNSVETSFPVIQFEPNALSVVNKINDINHSFLSLVESYKNILLKNEQAARYSVQTMKDTDQLLSQSIIKE